MLWLLLLVDLVDQPPAPPQQPAQAFVRIERASAGTQMKWEQNDGDQRREVHRIDENGRRIVLRLIEHQ
jgi:hypothetical protein